MEKRGLPCRTMEQIKAVAEARKAERAKQREQLKAERATVRLAARVERDGASWRKLKRLHIRGDHVRAAVVGKRNPATIEAKLGYSIDVLRVHLERQFVRGMNWDKFRSGRIHIDHRVPLKAFDLRDPDEARAAWAITNLQPLWAKKNIAKGAERILLV